jgi:hypothetical protein
MFFPIPLLSTKAQLFHTCCKQKPVWQTCVWSVFMVLMVRDFGPPKRILGDFRGGYEILFLSSKPIFLNNSKFVEKTKTRITKPPLKIRNLCSQCEANRLRTRCLVIARTGSHFTSPRWQACSRKTRRCWHHTLIAIPQSLSNTV